MEALGPVNTHVGSVCALSLQLLGTMQKREVTTISYKQLNWEAHIFTGLFFCSRVKAIVFY